MFQAAAGLALALRENGRLVFDLSRFRQGGPRDFALGAFGLEAELRPAERGFLEAIRRRMAKRRSPGRAPVPGWWRGGVYQEREFRFDPGFARLSGDCLIAGYFQSPRYFLGADEAIARAFSPEKLAGAARGALAAPLLGEHSVAVHLRLGDYAKDPRAGAVHGILPESYYDAALDHVRRQVPEARVFAFSDDAAAARAFAARIPGAQAMRGENAGADLYLMSLARHHVIANSSFSWWSAWLDRRPGGIRIAPEQWFTQEAMRTRPTDDLIPAGWVRL
jgi:hypothetical protein